jgi:hypothetical protein
MKTLATTLGALVAVASASAQDSLPDFDIPTATLQSVQDQDDIVREALFSTGIVAVTHIDGLDEARTQMFHELNLCALDPLGRETFPRFPMHDDGKTIRYSTAATITNGKLDRMTEPEACPRFVKAAEHFRRVVDTVSRAVIGYVDNLTSKDTNMRHDQSEDRSFAQLVQQGNHLEHFHFFESVTPSELKENQGVVSTTVALEQQQQQQHATV